MKKSNSYQIFLKVNFLIFTASMILFFSLSATAGVPTDFVKKHTDTIIEILKLDTKKGSEEAIKKREELKKIIDQLIDYDDLAVRSLGDQWELRTDEEKKEYKTIFKALLEKNYTKKLMSQSVTAEFEIEYEEEIQKEKLWSTTSVIYDEDTETVIELLLLPKGESFMVYDVIIDEISLEKTYQDNYTKIIVEDGFAELIKRMKKKMDELDN